MDSSHSVLKLYVRVIRDKAARYCFYLYARACILNRSECQFSYFYYRTISRQRVAGQSADSNVLLITPRHKVQVGFGLRVYSRPLPIRNIAGYKRENSCGRSHKLLHDSEGRERPAEVLRVRADRRRVLGRA